jgi:hypothetical protein
MALLFGAIAFMFDGKNFAKRESDVGTNVMARDSRLILT